MITANNLTIRFREEIVFENFSFMIPEGSKCCISGPSGCGKSTLLNSLLGFVKPASGEIYISGIPVNEKNITQIRSMTSYLPQELNIQLNSIEELVYYPFNFKRNKKLKPEKNEVIEIFSRFGLEESVFHKKLNEISGGQKQRIIIISCILQMKPVLIFDEPTSALDQHSIRTVMDSIFSDKSTTMISASHNEEWIKNCDLVIQLEKIN